MVFSDALEVAIGLTFVFLLISLAMTACVEVIESYAKVRGRKLFESITELLGDPARVKSGLEAARAIYSHPMLQGIFRGNIESALRLKTLPSYVPSRNFALALIDQALHARLNPDTSTVATLPVHGSFADRLRLAAERIQNDHLRQAVIQAVEVGGNDIELVCQHLEGWYDSAMDRVSGAYKRRSQRIQFYLGLVGAVLLNVNTLAIAESLSKDAALRRAVVSQVEAGMKAPTEEQNSATGAIARIDRLGLPIGWSEGAITTLLLPVTKKNLAEIPTSVRPFMEVVQPVLGWGQIVLGYLLTALAITLGAPFWFDILNRLMVIRATVKPREKSQEEGSEDRAESEVSTVAIVQAPVRPAAPPTAPPAAIDSDIYASHPTDADRIFEDEVAPLPGAAR
jgi:hypothetical protein